MAERLSIETPPTAGSAETESVKKLKSVYSLSCSAAAGLSTCQNSGNWVVGRLLDNGGLLVDIALTLLVGGGFTMLRHGHSVGLRQK